MTAMLKILVTGISGRMGQTVKQAVELNEGTEMAATHDVGQDIAAAMSAADCAIDFSFHGFTPELLATAVAQNKPLVIGTTGHTDEERAAIAEAAKHLRRGARSSGRWTHRIHSTGCTRFSVRTRGEPCGYRYRMRSSWP